MSSLKYKNKFISKKLINILFFNKIKKKKKNDITIYRNSTILVYSMKFISFKIYKGNNFVYFSPTKFCINFKFGEFLITRKPFLFTKKLKKKNFCRR